MDLTTLDLDADYDIAISFLNGDLALAQSLADALSKNFRVFIYVDRQVDLAGTNGLDSFSDVYGKRAKLVVMLHRSGYGETPWTRVEQTAIESRFLREGAKFLFVLRLEAGAPTPPWVPETYLHFDLDTFGREAAIGAISARALEAGATSTPQTPAQRAASAAKKIEFDAETRNLERTEAGVAQVDSEFSDLVSEVSRRIDEVQDSAPSLGFRHGASARSMVAASRRASLCIELQIHWSNSIHGAALCFAFLRQEAPIPGDGRRFIKQPSPLRSGEYAPIRTQANGWAWAASDGKVVTTQQLAEQLVFELLDHAEAGQP
ncbi:TIR domain-containing protein [Methylotetracoccus oryzae]|uniref:hypothetical protein n=1 Tax=Methylotetracoccus oryzae TaxID=1919059 RepID=UPI0011181940|nr:hypothetical protein [Methylotetracoccus oryzae]